MSSIPKPLKCMIKNLDNGQQVEAYFNPKEVSIDKKVSWNKHKSTKANNPMLEFTDGEPKNFSCELLFDGYETKTNVHAKYVKVLDEFTKIIPAKKRPPMCIFLWGKFPGFMGVLESLSAKYTMFLHDGTPVRATVTIKMTEAEKLAGKKEDAKKETKDGDFEDFSAEGKQATADEARRPDKFDQNHRGVLEKSGSENGQLAPGTVVKRP